MIRGAVYPVDLGDAKRGHEQRGRRFGLVVSIVDYLSRDDMAQIEYSLSRYFGLLR